MPGKLANWAASSYDEFESSIITLGNSLIKRLSCLYTKVVLRCLFTCYSLRAAVQNNANPKKRMKANETGSIQSKCKQVLIYLNHFDFDVFRIWLEVAEVKDERLNTQSSLSPGSIQ